MQGMLEARGLKRSHPDMEPNDPDATQWKTLVKDATTELDEKDHTTSLRMSCSTDELDDDVAARLQPFLDNFSVEDDDTPEPLPKELSEEEKRLKEEERKRKADVMRERHYWKPWRGGSLCFSKNAARRSMIRSAR